MSVRRLVLALGILSVGSVGAMAADLPMKAPPVAPPVIYNWTGFYIGGDVGWAHSIQDATTDPTPSPGFGAPAIGGAGLAGIGVLPTSHDLNDDSFLGGVHAGYNWQTGGVVLGIEGDFMFLGRKVSDTETLFHTFAGPTAFGTMEVTAKNDWLASLRGRLGWAAGAWMPYITGGAAWTKTSYSASYVQNPGALAPASLNTTVSFDDSKFGWTVGGGVEWMLAPHWILRAEYLYYRFDGGSAVLPFVAPGSSCTPGLCNWTVNTSDLQFHTARVGVSYKF